MSNLMMCAKNCHSCKVALCAKNCPLNMNIPLICDFLKENNLDSASEVLFYYNPFSYVTSVLCDHEKQCVGNCVFKSLKFNEIEYELSNTYFEKLIDYPSKLKNLGIAIVGGGIAGLTVAHYLLKQGITSTIYEKNILGGIIESAIPTFRFNNDKFKKHISKIESLTTVIYEEINEKNTDILKKYNHIIFSTGALVQNQSLDSKYLLKGIDILEEAKKGICEIRDKEICVRGLGNTACDVARTLVRLNNKVTIVYRRDIDSSPASISELNSLREEGIDFEFKLSPLEIIKDKKLRLITNINELIQIPGKKRKEIRKTDEIKEITCDYVVDATGSTVDDSLLKLILEDEYDNYCSFKKENPNEKFYSGSKVSVCGDGYYGAWNIAQAINSGLNVSKNIFPTYLFGGSFNPVTKAHGVILNKLSKNSKVIVVPNGDNYSLKDLASFNDRVEMLKLEIDNNENIFISNLEKVRPFKGTIETLRYYNHPIMVIGDDCLKGLSSWINANKLVEENKFLVFSRNHSIEEIHNFIEEDELLNTYKNHFDVVDVLTDEEKKLSSTDFRINKNMNNISIKVNEYIKNNKLYEV